MDTERHGISMGLERINDQSISLFKATGKLSHSDYESIHPMLNSALKAVSQQKIIMLVDISEFKGWELRAAWDDFKLDFKLGSKLEKTAIYGLEN